MPDLNGIELARVLDNSKTNRPRIIFTTAYNQFALEGYKVDALDYLLKPFSDERFESTMARAKVRLDERSMKEFGQRVVKMVNSAPQSPERRLDRLDAHRLAMFRARAHP